MQGLFGDLGNLKQLLRPVDKEGNVQPAAMVEAKLSNESIVKLAGVVIGGILFNKLVNKIFP